MWPYPSIARPEKNIFSSKKHKTELQEAITVQLNLIKSGERKAEAEEESDKAAKETAYRLRSKANAQEMLTESVK